MERLRNPCSSFSISNFNSLPGLKDYLYFLKSNEQLLTQFDESFDENIVNILASIIEVKGLN